MRAIIVTSHQDEQGTSLDVEAIQAIVAQSQAKTLPLLDNFDVSLPPIGKATIVGIERLEDGCMGLIAEVESEREIGGLAIGFSWSQADPGVTLVSVSATDKPSDPHCKFEKKGERNGREDGHVDRVSGDDEVHGEPDGRRAEEPGPDRRLAERPEGD